MSIETNKTTTEEKFREMTISYIGAISKKINHSGLPNMALRIQFPDSSKGDLVAHDSPELAEEASDVINLEGLEYEDKQQAITFAFEAAVSGQVMGLKIHTENIAYIFSEKHHSL